jgi:hypothetical protein
MRQIMRLSNHLFQQISDEGQHAQVACPLDGGGYAALVLQRIAGDAAGQNLALLVDELQQKIGVFVINVFDSEFAKTAIFLAFLTQIRITEELDIVFCCGHDLLIFCDVGCGGFFLHPSFCSRCLFLFIAGGSIRQFAAF